MPERLANPSRHRADPATAAELFLRETPSAAEHHDALVELARVAWSGEFPIAFYNDMAYLLGRLPWLLDRWVGQEAIDAISGADVHDLDGWERWEEPIPAARRRSSFTQMEGLLLLARLEAPEEIAAQDQLARVLDAADNLLVTDLRGTAKRIGRRHPLKSIFRGIGTPQTVEGVLPRNHGRLSLSANA